MARRKTYKREVSMFLLAFLCYIAVWGRVEVLDIIIAPFMIFILSSFGMDWIAKQSGFSLTRRSP